MEHKKLYSFDADEILFFEKVLVYIIRKVKEKKRINYVSCFFIVYWPHLHISGSHWHSLQPQALESQALPSEKRKYRTMTWSDRSNKRDLLFVIQAHDESQTHLPAFSHSALHEHFPVTKKEKVAK